MNYYTFLAYNRDIHKSLRQTLAITAIKLQQSGYIFRSGAKIGSEKYFELAIYSNSHKEMCTFNDLNDKAFNIARLFYSDFDKLHKSKQKRLARIVTVILGKDLNNPLKFLITFTKNGYSTNEIAFAITLAKAYNIHICDMFYSDIRNRIDVFINSSIKSDINI